MARFLNSFKFPLISALVLFSVVVLSRIIPHPWNFTAVGSAGLFAGFLALSSWSQNKGVQRWLGSAGLFVLPILAMLATDFLFFGLYEGIVFTYLALFVASILGGLWQGSSSNQASWKLGAGLSLLSSSTFFILSNFAVWKLSGMYAPTVEGLLQCYLMALPFFQWQVLGDLFYFGLFALALSPALKLASPRA
jgi:hypothetical protein